MKTKQYATYSKKQAKLAGTVEWATPSGGTVVATAIETERGCPGSLWDDKIDLGEVTHFVRRVTPQPDTMRLTL